MNYYLLILCIFSGILIDLNGMETQISLIQSPKPITTHLVENTINKLKNSSIRVPQNLELLFCNRQQEIVLLLKQKYTSCDQLGNIHMIAATSIKFIDDLKSAIQDSYINISDTRIQLQLSNMLFKASLAVLFEQKLISQPIFATCMRFTQDLVMKPELNYSYKTLLRLALGYPEQLLELRKKLIKSLYSYSHKRAVWYELIQEFLPILRSFPEYENEKNLSILLEHTDAIIEKFIKNEIYAHSVFLFCFANELLNTTQELTKEVQEAITTCLNPHRQDIVKAISELLALYKKDNCFNDTGTCYSPIPIHINAAPNSSSEIGLCEQIFELELD